MENELLNFTCYDLPVMVRNVTICWFSGFWHSLLNLNDNHCEIFIFLGLVLQAIFLALMRMVQNRGSKWKKCFSLYFQHYLMRCCCVLRFLFCLSAFLYTDCGMMLSKLSKSCCFLSVCCVKVKFLDCTILPPSGSDPVLSSST